MSDELMGTRQAAARAHRHQRTIVSWIRKGWLAAMKLPGGRGPYLIDKVDLDNLIRKLYTPLPYDPQDRHDPGAQ